MEVIEIISHYIDKNTNLISVEFRTCVDDDDVVREDMIEYSYYEEFGYDEKSVFDLFEDMDDLDDEWEDEEYDYISNEDNVISFLNEYYIVYPKKLPKPVFK
jgi:hypothetical protein